MAVKIRLKRAGSMHRPFYKIIVADSRSARDSAAIEALGYYNPLTRPEKFELDEERYKHWISVGASASEPVETLLRRMKRRAAGGETEEEKAEPALKTAELEADSAEDKEAESSAGDESNPDAGSGELPEGENDKQ